MESPLRTHRRVLAASLVGTAVEFYDFYVYATAAALVFGQLFFPAESTAAQQMFAFMSFGLAFVARPVGAIAFGHFGDRLGRKSTLVASLLLMGISTLLIAFLPTYAQMNQWGVGWVAPLLLCILRFGQGFGLGGALRLGAAPRRAGRPPRGQRAVPAARAGHVGRRLLQLGLARAVPAQRGARRGRPVGAAQRGRDAGVSRGARASPAGQSSA